MNINKAFDGGIDGREVLERFLDSFDPYLNDSGSVFILCSSLNDPDKTNERLEGLGMKTEIIAKESFFFEKLMVLKGTKP